MKSKRTEITIETDEIWAIRRRRDSALAWCSECAEQVRMITPDEAAILMHLSPRDIYRRVEAGSLHYREMPGGFLLVCLRSLVHNRSGAEHY